MPHKQAMYSDSHWAELTEERRAEIAKAGHDAPAEVKKVAAPTTPAATDVGTAVGKGAMDAIRAKNAMLKEALKPEDKMYEPWISTTPWKDDHSHLLKK
jgi:hypothetical protein